MRKGDAGQVPGKVGVYDECIKIVRSKDAIVGN